MDSVVTMHLSPLDLASFPLAAMSHHPYSHHHSSGGSDVAVALLASAARSQSSSPGLAGIQKLLRDILQSSRTSLQQLERLPASLHRLYLLHLTDGSRLILKCPPCANTRMLRTEHCALATEAHVLAILCTSDPPVPVPVPQLLRQDCSPSSAALGSPYILRTHIHGMPLASLSPHLSATDLRGIDRTLGTHLRSLSRVTAPAFGPPLVVAAGRGCSSWREAFLLLLEAVLRDAEDGLIALPYDGIRSAIAARAGVLDEVATPRLVGLEVGRAENVLVDERMRFVSGLVGWGSAVWGDPLLAAAFWGYAEGGEEAGSNAFWEGYGMGPGNVWREGERVRLLMYAIYRATVAVVTQYYRPSQEELDELKARRALTQALNELLAV